MFTFETAIDSIQNYKKQVVKTFVPNEAIANALNEFVDAQAEYTKKAVRATIDSSTTVTQEMIKNSVDAFKFDYNKFGEGIMKAYTDMNSQFGRMTKAYSKKAA